MRGVVDVLNRILLVLCWMIENEKGFVLYLNFNIDCLVFDLEFLG